MYNLRAREVKINLPCAAHSEKILAVMLFLTNGLMYCDEYGPMFTHVNTACILAASFFPYTYDKHREASVKTPGPSLFV